MRKIEFFLIIILIFTLLFFINKSVEAKHFSEPKIIQECSTLDIETKIAINSNNSIFIIWNDKVINSTTDRIFISNSSDYGESFSIKKKIDETDNNSNQIRPSIFIDLDDVIHIVWLDDKNATSKNYRVFYSYSINNGYNFSKSVEIPGGELGINNNPIVKVSTDGVVYIIWRGNSEIFFAKSNDLIHFQTQSLTFWDNLFVSTPKFFLGVDNQIYIVYTRHTSPYYHVYFMKSEDGGDTFSTPIKISTENDAHEGSPNIYINESVIYLTWIGGYNINTSIYFSLSFDDGKTFVNQYKFENDSSINSKLPSIQVDSLDSIYLLWEEGREHFSLHLSRDYGKTFNPPIILPNNNYIKNLNKALALGDNTLYIVWISYNSIKDVSISFSKLINDPPQIDVLSPKNNTRYNEDTNITFKIVDSKREENTLNCTWFSNISGIIGKELNFSKAIAPGSHNIEIFIIDQYGNDISLSINIHINARPIIKLKHLTEKFPFNETRLGTQLFCLAGSYDSDGIIISLFIDFGDGNYSGWLNVGNMIYHSETNGYCINHKYSILGDFLVKGKIRDDYSLESNWASLRIKIINIVPYLKINNISRNNIKDNDINFDASGSCDLDGNIIEYIWDFGNGEIAQEDNVTHNFRKFGEYQINLTVIDNDGHSNSTTFSIIISKKPKTKVIDYGWIIWILLLFVILILLLIIRGIKLTNISEKKMKKKELENR